MSTSRNLAAMARLLAAYDALKAALSGVPHSGHEGHFADAASTCAGCMADLLDRQSSLRHDEQWKLDAARKAVEDVEVEESELRRELLAFLKRANEETPGNSPRPR